MQVLEGRVMDLSVVGVVQGVDAMYVLEGGIMSWVLMSCRSPRSSPRSSPRLFALRCAPVRQASSKNLWAAWPLGLLQRFAVSSSFEVHSMSVPTGSLGYLSLHSALVFTSA